MTESTELTIPERATRALGLANIETELVELAERSKSITVITNPAGYDQCHAARMSLKNQRVEIERRGKIARDDATKFSKAVIAEEKRLISLIEPEELRLQALQKAHDDAIEAEKQAKIAAELARVNEIQARIAAIRAWPVNVAGKPVALVQQVFRTAQEYEIDGFFAEFTEQAQAALVTSIGALNTILAERTEFEAEQARIAAERVELERLRAEQARRDAEAREAREAEERVAAEARKREDIERRERMAAEEAALAARKAEVDRQEREAAERKAAIEKQEADAKARERAEAEAALKSLDIPSPNAPAPKPVMPAKPADDVLAQVIVDHFAVPLSVADYWLKNYGRMTRAA